MEISNLPSGWYFEAKYHRPRKMYGVEITEPRYAVIIHNDTYTMEGYRAYHGDGLTFEVAFETAYKHFAESLKNRPATDTIDHGQKD